MTLREALKFVNLNEVYRLIYEKDQQNFAECDRPTLQQTVNSYTRVVAELLDKPRTKAYKMPWYVEERMDPIDKRKYVDVCFLNPKYVEPPKGLKPYGGGRGRKVPEGCYNVNAHKYNKTFAAGWTPWSEIVDTPVINSTNYSMERAIAELLWELTFYGWTEEKQKQRVKEIEGRIEEAEKEIKEGKYIELPPKKKGGFKIVIPDTVSGQIVDIANKQARKNKS